MLDSPPQTTPTSLTDLRRPNFMVIGSQKCGSKWLYKHLGQLPQIHLHPRKEVHFFVKYQQPTQDQFQDYLASFQDSGTPLLGESTPGYFVSPTTPATEQFAPTHVGHFNLEAARLMRDLLGPEIKLIVSVRDPVQRAVSAFFHHVDKGRIGPGQTLKDVGNLGGITYFGFFGQHLAYWLEHFPRENFRFTSTEEIQAEPNAVLQDLAGFLGTQADPIASGSEGRVHEGLKKIRTENAVHLEGVANSPRVTRAELDELRELYAEDSACFNALAGRPLLPVG